MYPSALENVVRGFREIAEFEAVVTERRRMAELVIRIEVEGADGAAVARSLEARMQERLNLRPRVDLAKRGQLPRYELKARRFRIERSGSAPASLSPSSASSPPPRP